MTSLPKSSFDITHKRAICIASDTVTIYHWRRGSVTDAFVFDANDTGLIHFARYLKETPNYPVYIWVDLVEEEYRQDSIPPLRGSDRRAVLTRKQNRMFRGTPYCYAVTQGREPEGRRDEKILFTALTNPDIVAPWVKLCLQNKVPIAGLYSLPLLSQTLLPKLGIVSRNALLITIQSMSGLRQSYFQDGQLKVSRLARMPRLGTIPFVPYMLSELDKLRRYLISLRVLSPDVLDIFILSHGDLLTEMQQKCRNTDTQHYHLLDVAQLAQQIDVQGVLTTPFSDYLFAHHILQSRPRNQYAQSEERRYYRYYKAGVGMLGLSTALVLGSLLVSGFNVIQGMSLRTQGLDIKEKADFYQARIEYIRRSLPKTPVEPFDIKTAVDVIDKLHEYKTTPYSLLLVLSHMLDEFKSLQLDEVEWLADADPNAQPAAGQGGGTTAEAGAPADTEPGAGGEAPRYYQIARVKGKISLYDGDLNEANATIARFAENLRKQPAVHTVTVENKPFNTDSKNTITGDANAETETPTANFAIKVVMGVGA